MRQEPTGVAAHVIRTRLVTIAVVVVVGLALLTVTECTDTADEERLTTWEELLPALPGGDGKPAGPLGSLVGDAATDGERRLRWFSPGTDEFLGGPSDTRSAGAVRGADLYRLEGGGLEGPPTPEPVSIEGPGPEYQWRAVGESQGWMYRGAEPVAPVGLWWVDVYSFGSDRDAQTWYDGMAVPVQRGLASGEELDVPEALRSYVHASVHRFTFPGDDEDAEALEGSGVLVSVVNEQADVVYVFARMEAAYASADQLVDVATRAAVATLATARRAQ